MPVHACEDSGLQFESRYMHVEIRVYSLNPGAHVW
jgi:hypothetical protein